MRFFILFCLAFVLADRLQATSESKPKTSDQTPTEAATLAAPRVTVAKTRPSFSYKGLFASTSTGTPPSGYESSYLPTQSRPALAFYPFGKPEQKQDGSVADFKPSVQVGALIQAVGAAFQDITTAEQDDDANFNRRYGYQMMMYRTRLLVGGRVSPKTSFFVETEIPVPAGRVNADGTKDAAVGIILLDAQVEHIFNNAFSIIVGKQLVGTTRNSLQGAASLMALDFGYYQYPYSLFANQPLQNNFGRDIGIQARGFLCKDRLEYRAGVFRGGATDVYSPPRFTGRVNYNFLGKEKDQYYTGTTLGQGKIFAIGGGIDAQKNYFGISADAFLDLPLGEAGSVTCNLAYSHFDGGKANQPGDFTQLIPRQNILFGELGYYIKELKLQPYVGYEGQLINARPVQLGLSDNISDELLKGQNKLRSLERLIGGINYYFTGINMNVKAQYAIQRYGRNELNGQVKMQQRNEFWLQIQFFIF